MTYTLVPSPSEISRVAIRCPNCRNTIELASPRPGHYRPACPMCHSKFDLLIAKDPEEPPRVSKLPDVTAAPVAPGAAVALGAPVAPGAAVATAQQTAPPVARTVPPVVQHAPVDRTQFFTQVVTGGIAYDDLNGRLGGYEITKKLGQGGMGSVYLARQMSLDRDVALKTLSPTLATDPQFVARFTREAYAAAQLSHHNVVQIHDIGQDRGTNFFSMELIDGTDLAGVVEREGRLDPITAVTYTLQAARGLKFAHDHGLIHRDVKPENLLLNKEGLVKVADLGLVKRAGTNEVAQQARTANGSSPNMGQGVATTQLNTSMGTPAYMAPEQARDATKVDGRADIYSLGCTLYDLVTGRPPFSGKSAVEVMTKHLKEPITPPEKIVANLPKRLSEIIGKMTAKQPKARYQTMGQVVRDLEDFLGVEHGGGLRGGQDEIAVIGSAVERFNAAPLAHIRFNLLLGFALLIAVTLLASLLTLSLKTAGATLCLGVVAFLSYQVVLGVRQRTVLFRKVRQFLFGSSIGDWVTWLFVAGVAIVLLYLFGQLGTWVGVAICAAAVGIGFHFIVDHVVAVQRETPLTDAERLIRNMRAKGVDEEGIRGFIAKFSGRKWEGFYEALFGYESKIEARRLYGKGERGRDRRRHAVWRDWIINAIDRKLESRKVEREHRLLAKLEARALAARGVSEAKAQRQADAAASGVVNAAHAMRASSARTAAHDARSAETIAPKAAAQTRASAAQASWFEEEVPQVSESLEGYVKHGYLARRYGGPLDWILGRRVRFAIAAVVLIGAGKWARDNGAARLADQVRDVGNGISHLQSAAESNVSNIAAGSPTNPSKSTAIKNAKPIDAPVAAATQPEVSDSKPLRVTGVPDWLCDAIGSWNGLLAGGMLLLSCLPYGHAMAVLVLAGCGYTLFGHLVSLPLIGYPARWMTAAAGAAVALLSMLFVRQTID